MPRTFLIDTDTGSDDAVAIIMALRAPDIRVAASDANFSHPEVTVGLFPAGGATVRLVHEAGWANAMRYMLTGDQWDAEEARRLGRLNRNGVRESPTGIKSSCAVGRPSRA